MEEVSQDHFGNKDMFRESGIRKGKKSGMSLTVVKRINKICRIIVETIACFGSILGELHNSKIKNTALKKGKVIVLHSHAAHYLVHLFG